MYCQVKCTKGSGPEDSVILMFEGKDITVTDSEKQTFLSVADVRARLSAEGFIGTGNDESVWRFVSPKVKSDEKKAIVYDDRILGTQVEDVYPAKKLFINDENEIIITDVERIGRPDLIGFATDYFNDGQIEVTCRLRDYKEGDKEANAGKFQPVMLTDVISTRKNDDVNYRFVCVCCEDSVVEFPVVSFGSVGMVLRAEVNNNMIYDSAFHWEKYKHDISGCATVNCMKRPGEKELYNITVKNLSKDTSVVPGKGIRYQKITIYTHSLLSWKDLESGTTFTSESRPPEVNANSGARLAGKRAMTLNTGAASVGIKAVQSNMKDQITIAGDSYDPGEIVEGAPVKFGCGKWCRGDFSEKRVGSVSIYMFVFKTLEEAEKVIGRYNSLTESRQAEFWGLL